MSRLSCRYWLIKRKLRQSLAIASHITISERIALYSLSIGKNLIAEIGSYIGASACAFCAALEHQKKGKLICIDTWQNDAMTEGTKDTWDEFFGNTSKFSEFIIPVRGYSTNVAPTIRMLTEGLDVLFIDGDHSYEAVKSDWEAYRGFLRPGSTVIFHDYGWAEGVRRVVSEDVMPLTSHQDSLPNMWWGTIKGPL